MTHIEKHIILILGIVLSLSASKYAHANPESVIYISESKTAIGEDVHYIRGPATQVHAKDIPALFTFSQQVMGLRAFWHQEDRYTITTNGLLWTYPGAILTPRSICVMPERVSEAYAEEDLKNCAGICSDFISRYK